MNDSLLKLRFYNQEHQEYLVKICSKISEHYGNRLVSLAIFGSFANQKNRINSDLDLLVVTNDSSPWLRTSRTREFVELEMSLIQEELSLFKTGISTEISPLILTKSEAALFNPLYLDMTSNVLILTDQDDFLAQVLKKVSLKMKAWGSTKHADANQWYWDIQPNNQNQKILDYSL